MTESPEHGRNARVIRRFVEILMTHELSALDEVVTPDVIQEIPQSGERIRGLGNLRAVLTNYPGGHPDQPEESLRLLGEEPAYVMTPTFNLVRVRGAGDSPVAVWRTRYPDGSHWWVVAIITMRDDKIAKFVTYFAEEYPPPEWRRSWVERMDG